MVSARNQPSRGVFTCTLLTDIEGVTTVGVTSGASVPEILVQGVLERLAEYGYDTVQPVTTANETLVFSLPREIRPARG